MKFAALALAAFVLGVSASPASLDRRATSQSWAGTSNYFIQGMSDSDQENYLKQLADDGIKVIRLWVSDQPGNNNCIKGSVSVSHVPEFETTIGKYNYETLDLLDKTLNNLAKHGIKALISPHDGNKFHGPNGNDIYGSTYGAGYFYEKQEAFDAYDNRLRAILNYKGKYSGKVWKDWSSTIMGFDLENEPFASKTEECTYSTAQSWACGRAKTMRGVLGNQNPIKIATGGFGGDISHGCTFMSSAIQCPEIDIISVHRYAGGESNNQNQWANSYNGWLKQTNGKLVFVEEWGVNRNNYDMKSEFPANTKDMNNAGLPWVYWQILPQKKCDVGDSDPFGFFINSGVDVAGQVKGASNAQSKQDWSGIIW